MSKSKPELKLVEDTGSQLQDEDLSIELPPQQSEMPFAVVEGEPVTQLPRDLYIPPDALQVFLTAFEGPLDLLLYLIRKQNLDILNIPIAEITRQYMKYIEVMAELQLELAGEYLLMAAMLAEIKSRMLLPRPAAAEGQEEDDPRAELVRRLQEYERFKKAAEDIDRLTRLERDTMPASAELEERKVVSRPPDVTLKEMLDAFRDVLARAEKFAHHHISRERLSQRERMSDILARLQTAAFFEFTQLFKPEEGRMGVTVTFIAILELMKEGLIEIVQAEAYAPIHVRQAQRHLKVVQGGVPGAASDAADAENAAALAQPELAGENDIPDEEDETPPADEAATAVDAAVADVAAASTIAVDNIVSDDVAGDAGFVDAAVSEALASTETAVESIATEFDAAEVDTAEVVAAEVAIVEQTSEPDAVVEAHVIEAHVVEERVDEAHVLEAHVLEERVVEEHEVEEHEVEEHIVPEHVVEEHVVPEPPAEQSFAQVPPADFSDAPVVEDAPAMEAEVVVIADEVAVEFAVEAATDVVVEAAQPLETVEEEVEAAPALETVEDEVEAAPALETVEDEVEAAPVLETIEVVAENAADETTNVVIDDASLSADAAEFGEQTSEIASDPANDPASDPANDPASDPATDPAGELSVDDDTVTGSSSEADNSDAEPSR